jgi:hypothetical protein
MPQFSDNIHVLKRSPDVSDKMLLCIVYNITEVSFAQFNEVSCFEVLYLCLIFHYAYCCIADFQSHTGDTTLFSAMHNVRSLSKSF